MNLLAYKKGEPRVHISIDILILLLISTHCFEITPLDDVFLNNGGFTIYMLALAVIYIRNLGFQIRYGIFPKLKPMWWILAGVLISFIPAYLYYGQHLYHSLIVYRQFAAYAVYPVLLSIKPTKKELQRALYSYVVIYFFAMFWLTFIRPDWVEVREGMSLIQDGDFFHAIAGDQFILLALIFALDDFRSKKRKIRYGTLSVLIFVVIFFIQSRTILLASIIIIVMSVLSNKQARSRMAAELLLLFFGIAFFSLAADNIIALIMETNLQLSDPDYNRVKAFLYFISGENGWPSYLWGNGLISGNVHPLMEQLRKEGIFNSDLGLVGMWNQFGIIPSLTILVYVFKGMSKNHSFVVRANAVYILVGALSISYFYIIRYSLWLCLFFYFYHSDDYYLEALRREKEKALRRIWNRYRSISS